MDMNTLTQKSQEALQNAQNVALRSGHIEVDTEHLLLALLGQSDGLVPRTLMKMEVPITSLTGALEQELGLSQDRETVQDLLEPLRESTGQLDVRLSRLETDLNATLEDVFQMREEVRTVLATLELYRRASRMALEIQRDALLRQLEAVDSVLRDGPATAAGDG